MTRFRRSLLSIAFAAVCLVPFAGPASADPGDPGTTTISRSSTAPGWQGYEYGIRPASVPPTPFTTTTDPGDPGTTP